MVWAGFFLSVPACEEPALSEQFADEYKRALRPTAFTRRSAPMVEWLKVLAHYAIVAL